jgi:adenine phosphoribosyltransferase
VLKEEAMLDAVRAAIRDVPDFPKPGVVFKDITPILADARLFKGVIDALAERWRGQRVEQVVGIESRGFVFAAPLACALGAGLTIVRKPGKLPWRTIREAYALEYGEAVLELHEDALRPGTRVLVVDDVLATGGTAEAAGRLVARQRAELVGYGFVVNLTFLGGAARLGAARVDSLLDFG